MPLDRLRVANMENWGNLVKAWAKGEKPRPTTLDEFRDQCGLADVGMHVPAYVTAVQFAQAPGKETLLLRLPTDELVRDSEQMLQQQVIGYTIPDFYNRIFDRQTGPSIPPTDVMRVHAERIGDYTMSACM
jgi:hypothetical protein